MNGVDYLLQKIGLGDHYWLVKQKSRPINAVGELDPDHIAKPGTIVLVAPRPMEVVYGAKVHHLLMEDAIVLDFGPANKLRVIVMADP